jgi:acyl-CoA synthetase (AMP-forming)/AMP-acid ligase II
MYTYQTHLTVLQHGASSYPDALAFRVPQSDPSTDQVHDWSSISYRQFKDDVELIARYWRQMLKSDGVPEYSVVGLWYVCRGAPCNIGL